MISIIQIRKRNRGPKVVDINIMHRYRYDIVAKNGDFTETLMFGAYVLFPYPGNEE